MGIVHRLSLVGEILFSRLDELGEGRCILQGKWCPPGRDQLSISDGYALHPEWSWWTWVLLLGWSYWQVNILVVIYKSNTTIFSDVEGEWRWQGSGELVPDEVWNSGKLWRHNIFQMEKIIGRVSKDWRHRLQLHAPWLSIISFCWRHDVWLWECSLSYLSNVYIEFRIIVLSLIVIKQNKLRWDD